MPLTPTDTEHLRALRRQTLRVLRTNLRGSSSVALLDLPTHRNLGDSLIWAGAENYLAELGVRVILRRTMKSHRDEDLKRLPSGTTLLLQGGGNVGDLWPLHDRYRQHLAEEFPRSRILVGPQSVYYRDDSWAERARSTYGHHENITFLVRDKPSLERLRVAVPGLDVTFCPDAALGFTPYRTRPREGSIVVLERGDQELSLADSRTMDRSPSHSSEDWAATRSNDFAWRIAAKLQDPDLRAYRLPVVPRHPLSTLAGRAVLATNTRAAVAQLADAQAVATNRLHAHILASLMGIPNFVSDNSYGKISGVFEYTGAFSTAHMARSLSEATALADSHRKSVSRSSRHRLSDGVR